MKQQPVADGTFSYQELLDAFTAASPPYILTPRNRETRGSQRADRLPTLRKHDRAELDAGMHEANARVAEALFQTAIGDSPQSVIAAIFWLKTRAGWREKQTVEVANTSDESAEVERRVIALLDQIAAAKQATGANS